MTDNSFKMINLTSKGKIKKKSKLDEVNTPNLFKRFLAGFIDLVIIIACFVALQCISYLTVFKPLGYFKYLNEVNALKEDSHLFNKVDVDTYVLIEDNYEIAITYYYSNDTLANKDNKLEQFNNDVLKGLEEGKTLQAIYKEQYYKAIEYFKTNPDYITNYNKTHLISSISVCLTLLISLLIFYLLIPLLNKSKITIGQKIFKMKLISIKDLLLAKNYQIVLRFLVLVLLNYGISVITYFTINSFSFIPSFISLLLMSLIKGNRGPHDLLSFTCVTLK